MSPDALTEPGALFVALARFRAGNSWKRALRRIRFRRFSQHVRGKIDLSAFHFRCRAIGDFSIHPQGESLEFAAT
jgi:hypothetical protein